mmetsp:Transcript_96661/g.174568  ORF Transcript_96661/g.174568 Transcript_96661/m.174568 type:complete len:235 (-) Transcript_96661:85-789(-)
MAALKGSRAMPLLLAAALLVEVALQVDSADPAAWPAAFHVSLAKNRSGVIGHTDLYYDWLGGRNLHIDRPTTTKAALYDNERKNGSTYYYTPGGSCKVIEMGVGLLPPDWLKGAHYRGQVQVRNSSCHAWDKGDAMGNYTGPFIVYYEDVVTHLPVRWTFFTGMSFDVLAWEPGVSAAVQDWQIPAACFPAEGDASDAPRVATERRVDSWHLAASRLFGVTAASGVEDYGALVV